MGKEDRTVVSLNEHYAQIIAMLRGHLGELRQADSVATVTALASAEKAVAAALAAAEKATLVAEQTNKEWRAGANEWRNALADRERASIAAFEKFATRETVESGIAGLQTQLDDVKRSRDRSSGAVAAIFGGGGAIGAVVGFLGYALSHKP
jgi:hypothetical protein